MSLVYLPRCQDSCSCCSSSTATATTTTAAAATAAVDAVAGGVSLSQLTGGGGAAAAAVAETDLDRFLKVVGTTDWDNFLAAQAIGGPPNTQIVINAPAVSGQEVVEAIGKYVDGNGPLPPHWQQGAN